MPASHVADTDLTRITLCDNRRLLIGAPLAPSARAREHLNATRRDNAAPRKMKYGEQSPNMSESIIGATSVGQNSLIRQLPSSRPDKVPAAQCSPGQPRATLPYKSGQKE